MAQELSEAVAAALVASAMAAERAGKPSPVHCPEADRVAEAVAWVEANRAGGASAPSAAEAAPAAVAGSDEAMFAASPGRSVIARAWRDGDPSPYWLGRAIAGGGVLTVVRQYLPGRLSADVLALDALNGEPVVDTDDGLLAAMRGQREWLVTAGRLT